MKISHDTALASQSLAARPETATHGRGAQSAARPDQEGPQVALSPAARQLSALNTNANDIDQARVAAIRQAIAEGKLSINPERIADSVITSAQELLK